MFTPTTSSHNSDEVRKTPAATHGVDDGALAHARKQQTKAHFENRLRLAKIAVDEKDRGIRDAEREIRNLTEAVHRIKLDLEKAGGDVRGTATFVEKEKAMLRTADAAMHEKEQALHNKDADIRKIEHEIELLKKEIIEKERAIAIVKGEISRLMKEKEDFRRQSELGYFSAQTEGEHLHDKTILIQRLMGDFHRKEAELNQKERTRTDMQRMNNLKKQEVMELEAELRRLASAGEQ